MSCWQCYSKDETIRELEARIRYLESNMYAMIPVENPPHPDLERQIMFKFSEDSLSHSDRKW